MKRVWYLIGCGVLALALMGCGKKVKYADEATLGRLDELITEYEKADKELNALTGEKEKLTKQKADLEKQAEELKAKIAELKGEGK